MWCAVVYGGAIATKDRTGQLKEPHRGLIQPQKRQLKPNSFSSHGRQLAAHGPTIKNYCDHSLVALCLSKAVCIKHMLECNLDMRIAYDDIPASTLIVYLIEWWASIFRCFVARLVTLYRHFIQRDRKEKTENTRV